MSPSDQIKKSLQKTLAYASVFNCGLTQSELFHYAISNKDFSKKEFSSCVDQLVKQKRVVGKVIESDIVSYHPIIKLGSGVENISRQNISQDKLKKTRKWKKWLYLIPWIEAVLITGSVAANNAQTNDDIDIFIITKTKRLWLSRFLVIISLQILGVRRKPETDWRGLKSKTTKKHKNLVCANIYLDCKNLNIWGKTPNHYLARELAQAKVLFDKNNILPQLWQKNLWVKKFIPHSPFLDLNFDFRVKNYENSNWLLNYLDQVSFKFQKKFMKSKITNEVVDYQHALFHPKNTNNLVLKKYNHYLKSIYEA